MTIPIYSIRIPEYTVAAKPDFDTVGAEIDKVVKKHFLSRSVAIRCLSSTEHPGKTVDDIIAIVKKTGTDRYDPKRKGEKYDNMQKRKIDMFALDFKITAKHSYMKQFIESFYVYPIQDGSLPRRLDIAIIYDRKKLTRVLHQYEGRRDIKRDGFVFKDPQNKKDALLAIIKIL